MFSTSEQKTNFEDRILNEKENIVNQGKDQIQNQSNVIRIGKTDNNNNKIKNLNDENFKYKFDTHSDYINYLKKFPYDANVIYEYADYCWKHKQYRLSEYYCRKVIVLNEKHADAHNRLGTSLRGQNKLQEAIEEYRLCIKYDDQHKIAYSNLGNILSLQEESHKEAEECYLKAIEIDPNYSGAHVNYGVLLRRTNRFDLATKHYEIAMKLQPNDAWIYFNMANLMDELDKFEKSAEYYEKCLLLNPSYSAGYHNYAVLLHKKNKYQHACKQYHLSLLYEFDSSLTHRNYAILLSQLNDIENALYHAKYAIHFEKDHEKKKEYEELIKNTLFNDKYPERAIYYNEGKKLIC